MRIHTGEKNHKCTFCNKCFARSDHLKKHVSSHLAEQERIDTFSSTVAPLFMESENVVEINPMDILDVHFEGIRADEDENNSNEASESPVGYLNTPTIASNTEGMEIKDELKQEIV